MPGLSVFFPADNDAGTMRRRIFDVVRLEKDTGKSQFFNFPGIFRTVVDVAKLSWALAIGREQLKARPVADAATHTGQRR